MQQVSGVLSTTEDSIFVEEVSVGCHDPQPCVFANDGRGTYLPADGNSITVKSTLFFLRINCYTQPSESKVEGPMVSGGKVERLSSGTGEVLKSMRGVESCFGAGSRCGIHSTRRTCAGHGSSRLCPA